ncbi:hypothetical protein [Duffyella gerundensis]|uniref:hypothetical protein n=1 Tax=Duffyella gerundensis TaxID=1619313 RepID=UPI0016B0CE6D|nr:hypothetical protein [Duffyella gerundensis]
MKIPKTWSFANKKYHLVREFIEGDVSIVVRKFWSKSKGRWEYEASEKSVAEYQIELGKGG